MKELLVDGTRVDSSIKNDRCYVGIFPNTNANQTDIFYFGALYLVKYYTYFETGDYLTLPRIGTGFKRVNANILQRVYNTTYENYVGNNNKVLGTVDISQYTYEPNEYTGPSDNHWELEAILAIAGVTIWAIIMFLLSGCEF